jgi:beta-lactamase class A
MDMIERREFLGSTAAFMALAAASSCQASTPKRADISKQIQALEGVGRLGVCLYDTQTGEHSGHRQEEHFVMCSTFKLALAAVILREADQGRINLDEILPYGKADMVFNSPVAEANLAKGGMRIVDLARGTQTTSDNTAANLLTKKLGGPDALTAKLRAIGDQVTRIDRYEPEANFVLSADLRDTTTPLVFAQTVAKFTTGDLLKADSRAMLLKWMEETQTGKKRLRAGLPSNWRSGNKTGTGGTKGMTDKYNDVAITFPPGKAPIIIAAYYDSGREGDDSVRDKDQAVLAEVGRIAAKWVTG